MEMDGAWSTKVWPAQLQQCLAHAFACSLVHTYTNKDKPRVGRNKELEKG